MKYINALAMAGAAVAAPLAERATMPDIDPVILNFALTLEHLENVFYKGALTKYSEADFNKAGFDSFYYRNLEFIAHDEEQHVDLLTTALNGYKAGYANKACKYNFPYNSVKSFIGLSSVLEGVGVSAYLGAAPLVTSKQYLTVAGSILVTEAKHTSLQRYTIGEIAPENPYGTPLGPSEVYTLAAAFIVPGSCPASNQALPFTAFPSLTAEIGNLPQVGQTHITDFSVGKTAKIPATPYLTFISGLDITSVPATKKSNGYYSAAVPEASEGQTYVILTNKNVTGGTIDESKDIVAGPAILEVCSGEPTLNYNDLK